ncbi:hypothetical protein [Streptomyces sp. MMBL 11-1]|uniref:hypothetical protein n=1 Tax=Streptomyces sp. MMBL 11-1 TaxID=3026420 RepID=UPI0023620DC9|nr:hypothetical protein [Streptomyces sp. MMBL 11-1]
MAPTDVIAYSGLVAFLLGAFIALHGWTNRSAAPMITGLVIAVPAATLSFLMLLP